MPPSTGRSAPVIPDERSLARNSAARATSSSVAIRPSAVPAAASASASLDREPTVGRAPLEPVSQRFGQDRARAEPVDANPVAARVECGGAEEARAPRASMPCRSAGADARARRSSTPSRRSRRRVPAAPRPPCLSVAATPRTLTAKTCDRAASRSSSSVSLHGGTTPALATTTSSRPKRADVDRTAALDLGLCP